MKMVPVVFVWKEVSDHETGETIKAMVPQERFGNIVGRQFSLGEEYPLIVLEARSRASHNHFFAAVNDGFKNLPEDIASRWKNSTHLRKWCLIEAGWYDENEAVFENREDALIYVALVRRRVDEYARCSVHPSLDGKYRVIDRIARSQSTAAMGKALFEESKRAVLDMIEGLIGLDQGQLKKHAGRSG